MSGDARRTIQIMKPRIYSTSIAMLAALTAATAFSQSVVKPAPPGGGAETIYRQVTPEGRIVYSDKALPGARVDHTIKVDRPIKGHVWTVESGANPVTRLRAERTPIKRAAVPATDRKMSTAEAEADVIRAEMLLEDARKQQEAGVEPLPGERTGTVSGKSRLNEAYHERQLLLAKYVGYAEEALKKAIENANRAR